MQHLLVFFKMTETLEFRLPNKHLKHQKQVLRMFPVDIV